jgi:alpha-beta hydrolase superfamily lysophospholipase
MKSETISIERGGRAIFARRWAPEGAPRACVQIAHGLAEHSARYERLALALTNAGHVVTASDHRDHGPNCPAADLGFFADANGWRECLDDLQAVARRIAADFPGLPLVFFGHSMGSFMGQSHIAEHGAELEVVLAVVVGGASLNGGYGSIIGAALGVLIIGMIQQGLILIGISVYWYQAGIGLLLILAAVVNQRVRIRNSA